jgi:hypothetical protein
MRADSFENQVITIKTVDEQPIRFNMTVAVLLLIAGQLVVAIFGG